MEVEVRYRKKLWLAGVVDVEPPTGAATRLWLDCRQREAEDGSVDVSSGRLAPPRSHSKAAQAPKMSHKKRPRQCKKEDDDEHEAEGPSPQPASSAPGSPSPPASSSSSVAALVPTRLPCHRVVEYLAEHCPNAVAHCSECRAGLCRHHHTAHLLDPEHVTQRLRKVVEAQARALQLVLADPQYEAEMRKRGPPSRAGELDPTRLRSSGPCRLEQGVSSADCIEPWEHT